MKRFIIPFLAFVILFGSTTVLGQEKYERKSISYINALWLATSEARAVESDQIDFMLRTIKSFIEMERFDYNPLPDALIGDFVDAANAADKLTIDEIAALMQEKLAPKITEILDEAMNVRGEDLVSEEKKQTFMATKAKELGITLEEIEKVMNSAYIYLPVLTGYEREQSKDDKDKYTCAIKGGIIWFHVGMTDAGTSVKLRVSKTTISKGFGSEDFAWESAVKNFARNLEVATREIAEFTLTATISEVENGTIRFKMGKKEGLHRDDCFLVGEWLEYPDGSKKFEKSGWVRIGNVADNKADKTAKTSAWAVKKGNWAPGMSLTEHPRLGIDIALKPGVFFTKVTVGRIPLLGHSLKVVEDYESYAPGLDLDAQYNLAPLIGISQFFFLVGGNFVFPANLEFESSNTALTLLTATPPFIAGFHVGLLKKIYMGQTSITIDAKGGMRFFTVEQKLELFGTEYKYTIENNTAGAQIDFGLDYAFTPDINIGFTAGYRIFPVSEIWTQELTPLFDDALVSWDDQYPDIDHTGITVGLYIHYSPPALPFDPLSFLRGSLGE